MFTWLLNGTKIWNGLFCLGVTVEPHKKQLHVSLAYQFPTDKKEKLETLAKTINLKAPARWDLRLYSRDRCKANCQVYATFSVWLSLSFIFVREKYRISIFSVILLGWHVLLKYLAFLFYKMHWLHWSLLWSKIFYQTVVKVCLFLTYYNCLLMLML